MARQTRARPGCPNRGQDEPFLGANFNVTKLVSMDIRDPWIRRLLLPAYQVKDAARYAEVMSQTVRNWQRGGDQIGAAIANRKPRESLSYLQLQELAIVSAMRHQGIELQKIRLARDYLSSHFSLEFPFSDQRVKTDGQDILVDLKDELGRDLGLLVANRGGQYVWRDMIGSRFDEVGYEKRLAVRLRVGGHFTGGVIDSRLLVGAPAVHRGPTSAPRGRYAAGAPNHQIACEFVML